MDQSTDNDDDVIVMPMDAPSITEILDDDEEEALLAAAAAGEVPEKSPRPPAATEDSNEASQDVVVDRGIIKMPMPGVVHIKTEPKDDGYKEDEDDAFMDVGTIEPLDDEEEEEVVNENSKQAQINREREDDTNARMDDGTENCNDHQGVASSGQPGEEESSVLTVDTSETTRHSPETIALDSPMTPAGTTEGAVLVPPPVDMDQTLEMLDTLESSCAPVVTIVPNKIRLNISKLASTSLLQAEGNTDSRDSATGGGEHQSSQIEVLGGYHNNTNSMGGSSRPVTPEPEITYEVKETMRDAQFRKMQTVANGIETSGLCAIM